MPVATVKSVQIYANFYSITCTVNGNDYSFGVDKNTVDSLPDNASKLNYLSTILSAIRTKNILGDYVTTYNGLTFNVNP